MKGEKKKDNLTDLVEIVASQDVSGRESNNGVVTTPSGDTVTLGFYMKAKKLLNILKRKKQNERIVQINQAKKPK